MNVELQNKLLLEISKYSPSTEETDASAPRIDEILSLGYDDDDDVEKNIIQQLSTLQNPFFMKATEDYMSSELYKNDTVDAHMRDTRDSRAKGGQLHDLYEKYAQR